MVTDNQPTPTHEEMRNVINGRIGTRSLELVRMDSLRYVEQAESTAAELLKARERIAGLERENAELQQKLGPQLGCVAVVTSDLEPTEEEAALWREPGRKIAAIRLYRDRTSLGLTVAKNELERRLG